jgi:hypothetical protein
MLLVLSDRGFSLTHLNFHSSRQKELMLGIAVSGLLFYFVWIMVALSRRNHAADVYLLVCAVQNLLHLETLDANVLRVRFNG